MLLLISNSKKFWVSLDIPPTSTAKVSDQVRLNKWMSVRIYRFLEQLSLSRLGSFNHYNLIN